MNSGTRSVGGRAKRAATLLVAGTALTWVASAAPALAARRLNEKEINLDVARRTTSILRAHHIHVALTRNSDASVALGDRTNLARRTHADAFVSVHHNAGPQARSGTEIYRQVAANPALSQEVAGAWHERMPWRGIQTIARENGGGHDYYFVLRTSPVPAIIVEGAYLTNRGDLRHIADPGYRQTEAEATAEGIIRWLNVAPAQNPPNLPQGSRTTVDQLPQPSDLEADVSNRRDITLAWITSPAMAAYRVYRSGQLIGIVDNPSQIATSGSRVTFVDPWVTRGVTYHYEIRAVVIKGDTALESDPAPISATIPAPVVVIDPGHGGVDPGASVVV